MAESELSELESIVLRYNHLAMDYLKLSKFKDTFVLLKKAENVLSTADYENMPNRLKLISTTYNNLGCYYKKNKKPLVALNYLQKALDLEIESDSNNINIASSHLNMCAILSSISRHEEAFENAQKATHLLEAFAQLNPNNSRIVSNLVISYYNSAVELEFINKINDSIFYYEKALDLAVKELGFSNAIVKNIENALANLKKKLSVRFEKSNRENKAVEMKNTRFPSITPTNLKKTSFRNTMTPGRRTVSRLSLHKKAQSFRA